MTNTEAISQPHFPGLPGFPGINPGPLGNQDYQKTDEPMAQLLFFINSLPCFQDQILT